MRDETRRRRCAFSYGRRLTSSKILKNKNKNKILLFDFMEFIDFAILFFRFHFYFNHFLFFFSILPNHVRICLHDFMFSLFQNDEIGMMKSMLNIIDSSIFFFIFCIAHVQFNWRIVCKQQQRERKKKAQKFSHSYCSRCLSSFFFFTCCFWYTPI